MANRTDPLAKSIRGTDPQNLVEKILRSKIYHSTYWKEECFGLTAETLVDKAMKLDHIGGTFGGNRKPTPFMCLVMKMLQIQPEKGIVVEFIKNEDYKYVRVLGAFYLRLTWAMEDHFLDVYRYLEPLYNDYRKLRRKLSDGQFSLTYVDEFIDELLMSDYSCDIALPRIKKRLTLEKLGQLESRKSALEDDFEEEEEKEPLATALDDDKHCDRGPSPTREKDGDRRRDSNKYRDRDHDHVRDYYREYNRDDCDRGKDRNRYWDRDWDRDYHCLKDYDRDRDRERDRGCDRDRGHTMSSSRSRDGDRSRKRHARSSASPARDDPKKKEKKDDGTDHPNPEIAEANRLRASLGLKPLS